jgi:hypothetical protein
MFRLTLVLFITMLLAQTVRAADDRFSYGFLIGANQTSISGDASLLFEAPEFDVYQSLDARLPDNRLGMTLSAYSTLHINDGLSLRMEAMYTELGARGTYEGTVFSDDLGNVDFTDNVNLKVSSVELPILFIMTPPSTYMRDLRGLLGMSFGMITAAEMNFDSELEGSYYLDSFDFKEEMQTYSYSVIAGFALEFTVQDTPFLAEFRYKKALRNFNKVIGTGPQEDLTFSSLTAMLGIIF